MLDEQQPNQRAWCRNMAVISTTYLFRDSIKALFSKGSEKPKEDVIVESDLEDKDSEETEERVNTDE